MSHTKELIEEALDKVEKYLEEKHLSEDLEAAAYSASVRRTGINRYLNKLGVHVLRLKEWNNIQEVTLIGSAYSGKLSSLQFLRLASSDPSAFDTTYELLADEQSKQTFDWYVRYRTAYAFIGEEAYEIFKSPVTKEMWRDAEKQIEKTNTGLYKADKFLFEGTPPELITSFVIEQYRYEDKVKPERGDIVFDVGAYIGDTSLWFSKLVGPEGKVYSFEPEPTNFKRLMGNIQRNDVKNVIPLQLGLSDQEEEMVVTSGGGSSTLVKSQEGTSVKVTTIDNFLRANDLPSVDFIKMDVEGFESHILTGAKETLKEKSPKLAVCVYHRGDDLITLPSVILSINPNYKLYLRHCTPTWGETVLYASMQ